MAVKASTDALAKLVVANKAALKRIEPSANQGNGSQASGSQASASPANATLCQQAKEQLAIEDAKDKDKLLSNAEEVVTGNAGIIFKANEIVKALPPTVLAKMHCKRWKSSMLQWRSTLPNWRASPSMAQCQMTPSLCAWQS